MHLLLVESRYERLVVEDGEEPAPDLEQTRHQVLVLGRRRLVAVVPHEVDAGLNDHVDQGRDGLVVVLVEAGGELVLPGVEDRPPAHLVGLHVDHTAAGDGGRGGDREVHRLEDHVHVLGHLDDLPAHQAELLVVVEHGVHVLDPNGVDGAVENEPATVLLVHLGGEDTVPNGEDTIGPIVRDFIEVTIELSHGDGLRVKNLNVSFHFLHKSFLMKLSKGTA